MPTLQAFQMSLHEWHVQPELRTFLGLENYERMLSDQRLHQAVKNTFLYALLRVPAHLALGLAFALLLHSVRRGRGFFRAVFFAPCVAPAVAVSWVSRLPCEPPPGTRCWACRRSWRWAWPSRCCCTPCGGAAAFSGPCFSRPTWLRPWRCPGCGACCCRRT